MFWIIVLVIVIIVFSIIKAVKNGKEQKTRRQAWEELEARAATGDEAAIRELIEHGASSSCKISCAGGMPDNIVVMAERAIKGAVARNGGPGKFDWEQTGNKTDKAKYNESWTLNYKSPNGDSIGLVYGFYRGGSYTEEATGRGGYGVNSYIRISASLKMLPDKVQETVKQAEQELRDYLSSKGETIIKSRF